MSAPERAEWLEWPVERVSEWVAERGPVVMGWPFNGTRRWYLAQLHGNPDLGDYLSALIRRQGELHRMIFAHGVSALRQLPEVGQHFDVAHPRLKPS